MDQRIEKPLEEVKIKESIGNESTLILYNDEVNSFDHVINCLVTICGLDTLQAEQLALIVHHKGKAEVKNGDRNVLEEMCRQLCDQYLSATVSN